jgi:hypothetical protein
VVRENKVVNLPKTSLMLRRLLIIVPVVLVLILVSLLLPARQVTIKSIGTLSIGQEAAYASPDVDVLYPSSTNTVWKATTNYSTAIAASSQTAQELSSAEYAQVRDSDNSRLEISGIKDGNYRGVHFSFDLSSYPISSITKIKYTFEGYYTQDPSGGAGEIDYYTYSGWVKDQDITTSEAVYTKDFTSNFADYIDASGKFHFGSASRNDGSGNRKHFTNQAKLEVTYTPPVVAVSVSPDWTITEDVIANQVYKTAADYFTATNEGNVNENFKIEATDATGGTTWTLSGTLNNDTNKYALGFTKAGTTWPDNYNPVTKSAATFATGIVPDGTQSFGLGLLTPIITVPGESKTATVTISCVKS